MECLRSKGIVENPFSPGAAGAGPETRADRDGRDCAALQVVPQHPVFEERLPCAAFLRPRAGSHSRALQDYGAADGRSIEAVAERCCAISSTRSG